MISLSNSINELYENLNKEEFELENCEISNILKRSELSGNDTEKLLKAINSIKEQFEKHYLSKDSEIKASSQISEKIKKITEEIQKIDSELRKQEKLNAQDEEGNTALHKAIKELDLSKIRTLLTQGAKAHITNRAGSTTLHLILEMLKKTEEDEKEEEKTALVSFAKQIIKDSSSSELNIQDHDGWSALHFSVHSESAENLTKILLDKGANPFLQTDQGATTLHMLLEKDKLDLAALIIEKGSKRELELQDNQGNSHLHLASLAENSEKIILSLLRKNVKATQKNEQGCTPLHCIVVGEKNTVLTDMLKCYTADEINYKNNEGATVLHLAVEVNNLQAVKQLLEAGADLSLKDKNNNTALHLALLHDLEEISCYIIENSLVDLIALKNNKNFCPLAYIVTSQDETLNAALKKINPHHSYSPKDFLESTHIFSFLTAGKITEALKLLELACDTILNEKDQEGNSIAHFCIQDPDHKLLDFCIEKKISLLEKNNQGDLPLWPHTKLHKENNKKQVEIAHEMILHYIEKMELGEMDIELHSNYTDEEEDKEDTSPALYGLDIKLKPTIALTACENTNPLEIALLCQSPSFAKKIKALLYSESYDKLVHALIRKYPTSKEFISDFFNAKIVKKEFIKSSTDDKLRTPKKETSLEVLKTWFAALNFDDPKKPNYISSRTLCTLNDGEQVTKKDLQKGLNNFVENITKKTAIQAAPKDHLELQTFWEKIENKTKLIIEKIGECKEPTYIHLLDLACAGLHCATRQRDEVDQIYDLFFPHTPLTLQEKIVACIENQEQQAIDSIAMRFLNDAMEPHIRQALLQFFQEELYTQPKKDSDVYVEDFLEKLNTNEQLQYLCRNYINYACNPSNLLSAIEELVKKEKELFLAFLSENITPELTPNDHKLIEKLKPLRPFIDTPGEELQNEVEEIDPPVMMSTLLQKAKNTFYNSLYHRLEILFTSVKTGEIQKEQLTGIALDLYTIQEEEKQKNPATNTQLIFINALKKIVKAETEKATKDLKQKFHDFGKTVNLQNTTARTFGLSELKKFLKSLSLSLPLPCLVKPSDQKAEKKEEKEDTSDRFESETLHFDSLISEKSAFTWEEAVYEKARKNALLEISSSNRQIARKTLELLKIF